MDKYKQLREINLNLILICLPTCKEARDEFDEFHNWLLFYKREKSFFEPIDLDLITPAFDKHPKWKKFLLEKKFIKEEKSITYHQGQNFRVEGGEVYKLSQVDFDQIVLISMEDGNGWHFPPTEVEGVSEITEEEFNRISGRQPGWFALIEDGK